VPNPIYDQQTFADDLARTIKASQNMNSIRACLVTTRDRDHALNVIKETVSKTDRALYHFTVAGRRRYNAAHFGWSSAGGESPDGLSLLRHAQEIRGGGVVILEDCIGYLSDQNGDPRTRSQAAQMLSSETSIDGGLVLIFLEAPEAETRLPAMLADQFVRLTVPYPRFLEIEAIAREELSINAHRNKAQMGLELIRQEAGRLSPGLVGLTRSAARDALRDALAPNPFGFDDAFERLQRRKSEQLRRELAMNILDTNEVELPVGLDYLMDYLQTKTACEKSAASAPRAFSWWALPAPARPCLPARSAALWDCRLSNSGSRR
jgi:hypothetical protein